jgi:hypothetical protein
MKKILLVGVALALCASAYAQATKATAAVGGATIMLPNNGNQTAFAAGVSGFSNSAGFSAGGSAAIGIVATAWKPILTASFKPPGGKDLFITFSGTTGLFTLASDETQNQAFMYNQGFNSNGSSTATGQTGAGAASEANLRIELRVLIDSTTTADPPPAGTVVAAPGVITLDNMMRNIGLNSALNLESSQAINAFYSNYTDLYSQQILNLALAEGGVRSFTFIQKNVGVGTHTITVQARYAASNIQNASASAFQGSFSSNSAPGFTSTGASGVGAAFGQIGAVLGPRTLAVEEVTLN